MRYTSGADVAGQSSFKELTKLFCKLEKRKQKKRKQIMKITSSVQEMKLHMSNHYNWGSARPLLGVSFAAAAHSNCARYWVLSLLLVLPAAAPLHRKYLWLVTSTNFISIECSNDLHDQICVMKTFLHSKLFDSRHRCRLSTCAFRKCLSS